VGLGGDFPFSGKGKVKSFFEKGVHILIRYLELVRGKKGGYLFYGSGWGEQGRRGAIKVGSSGGKDRSFGGKGGGGGAPGGEKW